MGQINIEFFEAFKSLEKICNEMYGQNNSVTQYISDMEKIGRYDADRIPGWNDDLKELKRVRHIRNNMAHEDAYNSEACNKEDIEFLKPFRERIFKTEDPLALKHKLRNNNTGSKISYQKTPVTVSHSDYVADKKVDTQVNRTDYSTPKRNGVKLILFVLIVLAMMFLYLAWEMGLIK